MKVIKATFLYIFIYSTGLVCLHFLGHLTNVKIAILCFIISSLSAFITLKIIKWRKNES